MPEPRPLEYLFGMEVIESPFVPPPREITTAEWTERYVRHAMKKRDTTGALRDYDPGPKPCDWGTVLSTVYLIDADHFDRSIKITDLPKPDVVEGSLLDGLRDLRYDWLMQYYPPPVAAVWNPLTSYRYLQGVI